MVTNPCPFPPQITFVLDFGFIYISHVSHFILAYTGFQIRIYTWAYVSNCRKICTCKHELYQLLPSIQQCCEQIGDATKKLLESHKQRQSDIWSLVKMAVSVYCWLCIWIQTDLGSTCTVLLWVMLF